jgi:hypothetical protein
MTQDTSISHAKAVFGIQCVLIDGLLDLYRDIFVTVLQKCIKRVAVGPHSLGFVLARLRSKHRTGKLSERQLRHSRPS